jgi:hypothetical protein
MNWMKEKLTDESGLLFLVLAVIGAVAVVLYVAHRL